MGEREHGGEGRGVAFAARMMTVASRRVVALAARGRFLFFSFLCWGGEQGGATTLLARQR